MRLNKLWYAYLGVLLTALIACKSKTEEKISEIIEETNKVELVYKAESQLGEGPVWNAKSPLISQGLAGNQGKLACDW